MIRAVIDTNVLVSGLLRPSGNEALMLLAIHQGLVQPCFSAEILAEYAGVLARPKFLFTADEIAALIAMLRRSGELFEAGASPAASPDPADTKFLRCAYSALRIYSPGGIHRHRQQAGLSAALLRPHPHRERRRTASLVSPARFDRRLQRQLPSRARPCCGPIPRAAPRAGRRR